MFHRRLTSSLKAIWEFLGPRRNPNYEPPSEESTVETRVASAFEQSWQAVVDAIWHAELIEEEAVPAETRALR